MFSAHTHTTHNTVKRKPA